MHIGMNVLSLAAGILAWVLGLAAIIRRGSRLCSGLSYSCCGAALLFQLLQVRHLVTLRDWSALEDTIAAVVFAAAVLLCVTVLLNFLSLLRKKH